MALVHGRESGTCDHWHQCTSAGLGVDGPFFFPRSPPFLVPYRITLLHCKSNIDTSEELTVGLVSLTMLTGKLRETKLHKNTWNSKGQALLLTALVVKQIGKKKLVVALVLVCSTMSLYNLIKLSFPVNITLIDQQNKQNI